MSKERATVTYAGLKFVVSGEFTPMEFGRAYYPDGSGQPDEPSTLEIDEILWVKEINGTHAVDVDVTELLENISDTILMDLEELACNVIEEE